MVADEHVGFGTVCESHPCYLCPPGAESIHLDLTSPRGHERADGRVKLQVDWHRIDYLAIPIEEFGCAIVIEGHAVGSMSRDCRRRRGTATTMNPMMARMVFMEWLLSLIG